MEQPLVKIAKAEYEWLQERSLFLMFIEEQGLKTWKNYDNAKRLYEKYKKIGEL